MKLQRFQMMALSVIAASSSVLGVSSCVNQEYDLNKGIDKTVNLNGQISAPIGNTGKIMIGDFLELNGENGLVESETGDYSLEFSGSPVTRTVTVPAIELTSGNFIDTDGFEIAPIGIKASIQEANPDISDLIPLEGLDPVAMTMKSAVYASSPTRTVPASRNLAIPLTRRTPEASRRASTLPLSSATILSLRAFTDAKSTRHSPAEMPNSPHALISSTISAERQ